MRASRRILAILLIFCISLSVGIGVDLLWDAIEQKTHPQSYAELVTQYSVEYNIPEYIIYAVIRTESDFDPTAESSAGAVGLMQMMPDTFSWLTGDEHLREYLPASALKTPDVNIRYGTYYLRYLYRKFDYNWDHALAAYNGGEGNVARWLADPEYTDEDGNLTYIPFPETRSYVSKVNAAIKVYQKLYYEPNEGVST